VRVGVEKAVFKNLLEIDVKQARVISGGSTSMRAERNWPILISTPPICKARVLNEAA
jgi:hypothetical protein